MMWIKMITKVDKWDKLGGKGTYVIESINDEVRNLQELYSDLGIDYIGW